MQTFETLASLAHAATPGPPALRPYYVSEGVHLEPEVIKRIKDYIFQDMDEVENSSTKCSSFRKHNIVEVLYDGFSRKEKKTNDVIANSTCTLIIGRKFNIIVDTMTAWDRKKIVQALSLKKLKPEEIHYVVCTHAHSDHTGNNNLFQFAIHIVGNCMSSKERYFNTLFQEGSEEFTIEPGVTVISTPGHTSIDVSVLVYTGPIGSSKECLGTVAIVGDLFERKEDIEDESLWRVLGGSENPELQQVHRKRILEIADYIIPGHGPMFKNPKKYPDHNDGSCTNDNVVGLSEEGVEPSPHAGSSTSNTIPAAPTGSRPSSITTASEMELLAELTRRASNRHTRYVNARPVPRPGVLNSSATATSLPRYTNVLIGMTPNSVNYQVVASSPVTLETSDNDTENASATVNEPNSEDLSTSDTTPL